MEKFRCNLCAQLQPLTPEGLARVAAAQGIPQDKILEIKNANGGVLRSCKPAQITIPDETIVCFRPDDFTSKSS
jgi:hypothetical protein